MEPLSPEIQIENPREKALRELKELRYDYIDAIPKKELLPGDPNYHQYKCRMTFFVMVRNDLLAMKEKGLFSSELKTKIDEFDQYVRQRGQVTDHSLSVPGPARTTQGDIDYVNSILDTFILALS